MIFQFHPEGPLDSLDIKIATFDSASFVPEKQKQSKTPCRSSSRLAACEDGNKVGREASSIPFVADGRKRPS